MASLSTFLCVEVSRDIQRALQRVTQRLARVEPFANLLNVRWVAPEQMHLTLTHLGEVDWNQTHQICQIARQVVRGQSPISISCEGLGAFPSWEQPRVLWAGVTELDAPHLPLSAVDSATGEATTARVDSSDRCPELRDISCRLVQELLQHRFFPDTKPWVPHVTLGRVLGGRSREPLAAGDPVADIGVCDFGCQNVRELKLMSSERTAAGPVYRPIGTIPFD
jgi:2'-5' RNA ligase